MLGLALITLAGVGWQRLAGGPPAQVADVTWQRALHFEDRSNGDVAVLDAQDRREVARFQGEQGFLRGALRTLARERLRRGMGPPPDLVRSDHRHAYRAGVLRSEQRCGVRAPARCRSYGTPTLNFIATRAPP
jgi:putative photosynthetic complex assembly protein